MDAYETIMELDCAQDSNLESLSASYWPRETWALLLPRSCHAAQNLISITFEIFLLLPYVQIKCYFIFFSAQIGR